MVVTRRVPSPRSVRHLLQVASVSAKVVGKRVLYVKHGRSASSRASPRRALCAGEVQLCCERWPRGPPLIHGALPRAAAAELKSEEFFGGPPGKPKILHHPHLKPPETVVSLKPQHLFGSGLLIELSRETRKSESPSTVRSDCTCLVL